eukprot:scaffold30429_cov73-Skeletonema_dohrnii-CCMP3373.AAC.1
MAYVDCKPTAEASFAHCVHRNLSDPSLPKPNMERIRALPSGIANHVRASQVIGSIERGVEELLQNSIIHGAAKCVSVTMGKKPNDDFVVVVEDDGV